VTGLAVASGESDPPSASARCNPPLISSAKTKNTIGNMYLPRWDLEKDFMGPPLCGKQTSHEAAKLLLPSLVGIQLVGDSTFAEEWQDNTPLES